MEITLNKRDSTEAVIKITLKPEDYQSKWEGKIKDYGKKAQIKGFRPGKVPTGFIKKMYGKSLLVEEINHLLSHKLQDYIKDQNLPILGEPIPAYEDQDIADWDNPSDFSFSYEIGMAEEFEVPLDKKVVVESYEIEVDQKELDQTIENLKRDYGTAETLESVTDEATVAVELAGEEDAENAKTIIVADLKKAGKEAIAGKKEGEKIQIEPVKWMKKDDAIEWLGLDKGAELPETIEAEIKSITSVKPAEIDQEFIDKIIGAGKASNEDEFIAEVKAIMAKNYQQEIEGYLTRQVRDKFISDVKFELPNTFLKKWLTLRNEKATFEQIEKEYPNHEQGIRWELILNKIQKDNEIKVEHEDVISQTMDLLRAQFGNIPQSEEMDANMRQWADNYLKGEDGKNYMNMVERISFDRTMDLIREKITIKTTKISWEDFQKKVSN